LFSVNFKRHDPKDMIKEHCRLTKYSKSYYHERCPFDILFQVVETFEDVKKIFENVQDTKERDRFVALRNERWKTFCKKKKIMSLEDNMLDEEQNKVETAQNKHSDKQKKGNQCREQKIWDRARTTHPKISRWIHRVRISKVSLLRKEGPQKPKLQYLKM
jgi:hypothetical protein